MPHDHGHDHHGHGGGHSHAPASFGKAFAIGVALNTAYVALEATFGVMSGSLALLADAGHNLSDVLSLLLAWGATWLSQKPPKGRRTYGYKRAPVLASLANGIILLVAIGAIAWEAIRRLADPVDVASGTILWVAVAGLFVNGITAWMFMSGRDSDLNIRGAFLHMAADTGVTAGVIVAALVIMWTGWLWVDPAISLVIAIVILVGTWGLLRDSTILATDAVPPGIDREEVERHLAELPPVQEVHDLHIWALSTTETALTAHLVCDDLQQGEELLRRLPHELHECFAIDHATLQLETPETARQCELRPQDVV